MEGVGSGWLFVTWGEVRRVSRGSAGGVALGGCCVQGACSVLCFCSRSPACAPGSSNVAAGFLGLFL